MARTPFVVGNWKLNKTVAEAQALVTELKNQLSAIRGVEVGVAPVALSISAVAKRLEDSGIRTFGQNCHWEESGAWTGEISPTLLSDAGARGVIIGHSERRTHFGETDESVGKKVRAALDAGLQVIICVGETESERDSGQTDARISAQVAGAFASVKESDFENLIAAYEPVWAIGTGRTATPAQAQEVHKNIRDQIRTQFGGVADQLRIQYGGSVKPANAESLMREPDIDGALVGGASLKAEDFVAIVKATRLATPA